jgi:S-formylglutathione hydrolase FrmB
MKAPVPLRCASVCLLLCSLLTPACKQKTELPVDHPRLNAKVTMRDVTFHSTALNRDMPYRVLFPSHISTDKTLPVLYLLHGGGGGFRDWSNYSDVAEFAALGILLIMPEGESSYYVNSAEHASDRYEDFIVHDLIADVEKRFPAAANRNNRAVAGVSMGGYGAITLALKHPDLFVFAAGISPAIDVPSRPFSWKRLSQSRRFESIFGPKGSATRRENDPFVLVRSADPARTPYLFITSGEQESFLAPTRKFAALLQQRQLAFEFHTRVGNHDWQQWNHWVPILFQSLSQHVTIARQ